MITSDLYQYFGCCGKGRIFWFREEKYYFFNCLLLQPEAIIWIIYIIGFSQNFYRDAFVPKPSPISAKAGRLGKRSIWYEAISF